MVIHDIFLLSPEISLAILAVFVLGLRLSKFNSRVTTRITLIGFLIPLIFVALLWGEVSSDVNLKILLAGGNLTIDYLALFFKMFFLIS
jgi:hypothetical protein